MKSKRDVWIPLAKQSASTPQMHVLYKLISHLVPMDHQRMLDAFDQWGDDGEEEEDEVANFVFVQS